MLDVPLLLLALTLLVYWARVSTLILRARQRRRHPVGVIPRLKLEKLLWAVWVPLVLAWLFLPIFALASRRPHLAVPEMVLTSPALVSLRWFAAAAAVTALFLTWGCWRRMGRWWRIAILPGEKAQLVTDGFYARVRHPIYALSMALMLSSAVILPTLPMATLSAAHVTLILLKSWKEEEYLASSLGEVYTGYCRRTGRFLPRLRPAPSDP